MKIDSFPLTSVTKVKKKPFARSKGFQAHLPSSKIDAAATLLPEELLWSFQEFDSFLFKNHTAYKKGEALLLLLNALRIDLLNGSIPYSRIQALNHFLQSLPENNDASLQEILDEIILRVQIELTKIEKTF